MSKGQPREGGGSDVRQWLGRLPLLPGQPRSLGEVPPTHPIRLGMGPRPLTPVQNSVAPHAKFHLAL